MMLRVASPLTTISRMRSTKGTNAWDLPAASSGQSTFEEHSGGESIRPGFGSSSSQTMNSNWGRILLRRDVRHQRRGNPLGARHICRLALATDEDQLVMQIGGGF